MKPPARKEMAMTLAGGSKFTQSDEAAPGWC